MITFFSLSTRGPKVRPGTFWGGKVVTGLELVVGDFQTLKSWVFESTVVDASGEGCCLLAKPCLERQVALLRGAAFPAFLCPRQRQPLLESG